MQKKLGALAKLLVARGALKGLVVHMNIEVVSKICLSYELLRAKVARKFL